MREDDGGDVLIREMRVGLSAEETICKPAACGDGDRGELEALIADIAERVDVVDVGVLVLVHLYMALLT